MPHPGEAEFLRAALWHGDLAQADAMLAADPSLATSSIHTAAVLADEATVRAWLARDPTLVHAKAPPHGGDALNYLCLSKYLRLDAARTAAFVRTATILLDAGADPNTGFTTPPPHPETETALYGAAGVAHNEPVTRLLLERGADPNDVEVTYHAPESYDLGALKAVVDTGKLTPESLTLMLLRKIDWHDHDGVKYLLDRGASATAGWGRNQGVTPLSHAIARDNWIETIRLLLEHGARPDETGEGSFGMAERMTALERSVWCGRSDLLALYEQMGFSTALDGYAALLKAAVIPKPNDARALLQAHGEYGKRLQADAGRLLAMWSLTENTPGVRMLLDLGLPVDARFAEGYGYFGIAPGSTALHVAAHLLRESVVALLLERGADVHARNASGRTPLQLAMDASVNSYWTERRSVSLVRRLLEAGAEPDGIPRPSGWPEGDALLHQ